MNKVRAIEKSLSCFRLGVASLLPLIGVFFAVIAIGRWQQARRAAGGEWNPGARLLRWGLALAGVGLLVSLVCWALVIVPLIIAAVRD